MKFELQEENIVETLYSLIADNWENLLKYNFIKDKDKDITKESIRNLLEQYVIKLKEEDKLSLIYQYISSSIKHVKKLVQLKCENSYGDREDNKIVQEIEEEKKELDILLKKTTAKLYSIIDSFNKLDLDYNNLIDDFTEKYLHTKGIINHSNTNNSMKVYDNEQLVVINTISNDHRSDASNSNEVSYLSNDLIKKYVDQEISLAKNKIELVDSTLSDNEIRNNIKLKRENDLKNTINKLEEDNYIINQFINNTVVDFNFLNINY